MSIICFISGGKQSWIVQYIHSLPLALGYFLLFISECYREVVRKRERSRDQVEYIMTSTRSRGRKQRTCGEGINTSAEQGYRRDLTEELGAEHSLVELIGITDSVLC